MYDEPESSEEGACLRYMLNPSRQMKGSVETYEEPESPNEGACVRYIMNPNRQMGACFRWMFNRHRQRRVRCV